MNPWVDIENGVVSSKSEWVRLPPSTTTVNDQERPIRYYLNDPEISDLILKKSLGARVGYDWKLGDYNVGNISAYGLYKPENNLRVNAEAFYDLDKREVSVFANPIVNHHMLFGINASQRIENIAETWIVAGGVEFVDPNARLGKDFDSLDPIQLEENNRNFESDFFSVKPSYDREAYFQSSITRVDNLSSVSLNYFRLLSDQIVGDDFYSNTNRWVNAIGVNSAINLSDKVALGFDIKYDFDRKDTVLLGQVGYQVTQNFLAGLGVELLDSPNDDSFWAPYRANDSLYIRMGYIF